MGSTFWKKGLRFACQGSGKCCTSRGEYGYVYMTLEDRRRMAAHFEMRTSSFTRRYCERDGAAFYLKNPERDCAFLDGASCSVYEARPVQCRTWPFWPENMKWQVWEREVAAFCPGVGQGKLYTAEEIKAYLDLHRSR